MASAFHFDSGTYQGRIPVGSVFVYELGHALAHQFVKLQAGDSNVLTQAAGWAPTPLTRVALTMRAPSRMPAGTSWSLVLSIGSDDFATIPVQTRPRTDLALPTLSADLNGDGAPSISIALVFAGTTGVLYDVELPSVQLEAVTLDTTTAAFVVANRDPEPGDTGVSERPTITLDVLSAQGALVTPSAITVFVAGVLALQSGSGQSGWGATISPDADGGDSYRVSIKPPVAFAPNVSVPVRVVYQPGALDITYAWMTVDTTAPLVKSVTATDEKAIVVVFNKTLAEVGSYTLTLLAGAPAVTPNVLSAALQIDGSVLLTTDIEQTPGAFYQLGISGVVDLLGNEYVDPFYLLLGAQAPTATFVGFTVPRPPGRSFDLYEMMLTYDRQQDVSGDLAAFIGCFQEVTNLLLGKLDRFASQVVDPDSATEQSLDAMLVDLGNPFAFDMDVDEKRRLVQLLVAIYKLKGTDAGIINAIRFFLGLEVTIDTPWQSGWHVGVDLLGVSTSLASTILRDLYSYNIVSVIGLTADQLSKITAIARYMQRAPCHLRAIIQPSPPPVSPDHWSVSLSLLGTQTILHVAGN